jgi:hypothetical protein
MLPLMPPNPWNRLAFESKMWMAEPCHSEGRERSGADR